jgi:hypothetical protein
MFLAISDETILEVAAISGPTLHRIELGEHNVMLDTLEQIMDRLKGILGRHLPGFEEVIVG